MRRLLSIVVLVAVACAKKETPVPASQTEPPPRPAPVTSAAPPVQGYGAGLSWLAATPGFDFELDDHGLHAEGTMLRKTIGAESVLFRTASGDWRASAGRNGVAWERRQGAAWTPAEAPEWGNRLYQRLTIAIDPQKKEGEAALIDTEGGTSHYRFTDANSGEVHDVWLDEEGRIERMTIGPDFSLSITNAR